MTFLPKFSTRQTTGCVRTASWVGVVGEITERGIVMWMRFFPATLLVLSARGGVVPVVEMVEGTAKEEGKLVPTTAAELVDNTDTLVEGKQCSIGLLC